MKSFDFPNFFQCVVGVIDPSKNVNPSIPYMSQLSNKSLFLSQARQKQKSQIKQLTVAYPKGVLVRSKLNKNNFTIKKNAMLQEDQEQNSNLTFKMSLQTSKTQKFIDNKIGNLKPLKKSQKVQSKINSKLSKKNLRSQIRKTQPAQLKMQKNKQLKSNKKKSVKFADFIIQDQFDKTQSKLIINQKINNSNKSSLLKNKASNKLIKQNTSNKSIVNKKSYQKINKQQNKNSNKKRISIQNYQINYLKSQRAQSRKSTYNIRQSKKNIKREGTQKSETVHQIRLLKQRNKSSRKSRKKNNEYSITSDSSLPFRSIKNHTDQSILLKGKLRRKERLLTIKIQKQQQELDKLIFLSLRQIQQDLQQVTPSQLQLSQQLEKKVQTIIRKNNVHKTKLEPMLFKSHQNKKITSIKCIDFSSSQSSFKEYQFSRKQFPSIKRLMISKKTFKGQILPQSQLSSGMRKEIAFSKQKIVIQNKQNVYTQLNNLRQSLQIQQPFVVQKRTEKSKNSLIFQTDRSFIKKQFEKKRIQNFNLQTKMINFGIRIIKNTSMVRQSSMQNS